MTCSIFCCSRRHNGSHQRVPVLPPLETESRRCSRRGNEQPWTRRELVSATRPKQSINNSNRRRLKTPSTIVRRQNIQMQMTAVNKHARPVVLHSIKKTAAIQQTLALPSTVVVDGSRRTMFIDLLFSSAADIFASSRPSELVVILLHDAATRCFKA